MSRNALQKEGQTHGKSVMVINTNISASNGARYLADSSTQLSKSLSRLSSGSKITSPEDDAAGMAVSTKFDAQVSRLGAVSSNLSNAVSFSQTQDGYLQKVAKALDRMSELSVLAQDVTKTGADLNQYDKEYQKLNTYIADVATKDFNGISLFSGDALNVTTDSDANTVSMDAFSIGALAVGGDLTSATNAKTALDALKGESGAINSLATDRAIVGANISVLNSYNSQVGVLKDNLATANSRIKDTDVAYESTNYARANILVQSGTAMLAQANQSTQGALKLLGS
jgi:flagellin